MHLIKLVACNTLQSFQSVFCAQCNSEEKTFSSFIFDGNFRERGTVYVSRTVVHLQGVVLGPENHTKTGFVPRCLHS